MESERKNQCERETSICYLAYAPTPRTEPTTWACSVTGNGNGASDLSVHGTIFNHLSHTGQGLYELFND